MDNTNHDETRKNVRGWLVPFFLVFSFMAYLTFKLSFPLIQQLSWAVLFSFIVYPLYKLFVVRIFRGRHQNIAAAIATGAIMFVLAIPGILGVYVAAKEGLRLYGVVADNLAVLGTSTTESILTSLIPGFLVDTVRPWMERYPFLQDFFIQTSRWLGAMVITTSRKLIESSFTIGYSLVIIVVTSFLLIRDGHRIMDYLMDIVPLPEEERIAFLKQTQEVLQGVVYGVLLTALLQGLLGTIGWWYVGLPSPIFFGALMMILAMIPFVGTPIIWGPGGLYLLCHGEIIEGLVLLAWGVLVVSMVDNFIRPIFISSGAKVHMLITFLGALGGLAAWGFIGLFWGPLVVSLFVFLLGSYRTLWKSSLSQQPDAVHRKKDPV